MRTIKISFPQVVFEFKEIQVPDEVYPEDECVEEQAAFVYDQLSDLDKNWLGKPVLEQDHLKLLEAGLDLGYIKVEPVEK